MAVIMRPAPGWARTEDDRLVRGAGRFTDNLQLANAAVGVVVRSPHAAAEIVSIETAQALQTSGVLAIYTAEDLAAAGIAAGRSPQERCGPKAAVPWRCMPQGAASMRP